MLRMAMTWFSYDANNRDPSGKQLELTPLQVGVNKVGRQDGKGRIWRRRYMYSNYTTLYVTLYATLMLESSSTCIK